MAKFAAGAELVISNLEGKVGSLAKLSAAAAAIAFAEGLRAKLTGPRSGRVYRHPRGGTYQASEPGSITAQEYPAERMGDLRRSIDAAETRTSRTSSQWAVGSSLFYAGILMEGSDYMVARMFLYKHMLEEREAIERILGAPFTGDQSGGGRAVNPLNFKVGGKGSRTAFNRRRGEIESLLEKTMDTKVERARTAWLASYASREGDWRTLMRDIREDTHGPKPQRFRWGQPY